MRKWFDYYNRVSNMAQGNMQQSNYNYGNQQPNKNNLSKNISNVLRAIGLVIVGVCLIGSIYNLDTGTTAVVTRFEEVIATVDTPGIHFKVPVIDSIQKVKVETVHKLEYGFRTTSAGDGKTAPSYEDYPEETMVIVDGKSNNASIVLLDLIARVQVVDPINFLYEVDDLDGTLSLALEDVVRSSIQSLTLDQAVENKEEIDKTILPLFQRKLDKYNAGLKVISVTTQNVQMLPSVEEARKKVEEANQYKRGKEEEAEKVNNTVIPRAQATAIEMVEDAKGYSADVVASAKADVSEFEALYSEYLKNPKIVKEKYYIEAMQKVLEQNNIVIDYTAGQNMLKFFDVNKLDQ